MKTIQQTSFWLNALVVGFILSFATQAHAQSYPSKPVHIIVGVSPGGGVDFTARVLAQNLSKLWGQPVIVENRLGAAGTIANEYVAKSTPDGYTLLATSDDIVAASAYRTNLPYDLQRDLTPVSLVGTEPILLVVTPSLPVHNVKELVALAKSEPGKLTYGTPGVGSDLHMQTALFASMANINVISVPYKGSSAAATAVAAGEVNMAIVSPSSGQSLAKAGKLRILAVTTAQRSVSFPSVPTIQESGVPNFAYFSWIGIFAPVGMPKDVLATLNAAIAKVSNSSEMKTQLAKQDLDAQPDSPAQFAAFVGNSLEGLQKIVKIIKQASSKTQ